MDETPDSTDIGAPAEQGVVSTNTAPPVEAPPVGDPVTAKSLWRDAALDLLAALGAGTAMVVMAAIVVALTGGIGAVERIGESAWGIAFLLLATQLPFLVLALRRRRRNREKRRPVMDLFGGRTRLAVALGILAGLGMTVLSISYNLALQGMFGEGSVENQLEFLRGMLEDPWGVTAVVAIISILAPFGEEIFFRGAMFGSARPAGFNKVGIVISAVFFATVHGSPKLAPFYATFAVAMCWLYARTETLAAPIAAHMTMNSIACTALLFSGDGTV